MKKSIVFICLTVLLSGLGSKVFASREVFSNGLSGSGLQVNTSLTVTDQYFGNPSWEPENITTNSSVIVKLSYDQTLMTSFPTCTVNYTVKFYSKSNVFITSHTGSLSIGSDKDKDWVVYEEGLTSEYYKAIVTIETGTTATIPLDVHFDVCIEKERSYELSATALDPPLSTEQANGVLLAWDFVPGAVSYDVEWLFFENNPNTSAPSPEVDFSEAYRINTSFNSYILPNVYSRGGIVYRVRARGYGSDPSNTLEGNWSYAPSAGTLLSQVPLSCMLGIQGIESGKNWIYTAAYAEEGLRMDGIAYYDGAFKQRQTLSSANTDNVKLVSETYYDYHNRPVIQTLPAVVQTEDYDQIPLFNPDYGPALYDDDNHYLNPSMVSSSTILGGFYSDVTSGLASLNAYLPDANGYPYSRTIYTSDPSGRVRMSTMAGAEFKAGDNRETRYYYGTAPQVELDRLFGNNVGDALYYSKDMVRDANGQISVSYKDLQGRVVATGIAALQYGSPYIAIDNAPYPEVLEDNLMVKNIIGDENSALTFAVPVSTPGNYAFEYSLTPEGLSFFCNAGYSYFSRKTYFDIRFYVTDQFGEQLVLSQIEINGQQKSNNNEIVVSIADEATVSFVVDFIEIGTYYVYKVAVPNSEDIEDYVANENNINGCVEEVFVAPDPCPSCCADQCTLKYRKEIAPLTYEYVNDNGEVITPAEGQALIDTCQLECAGETSPAIGTSQCELQYEAMKIDMSPVGQYFDNTIDEYIEDVNGNLIKDTLYDHNEFIAPLINPMVCSLYALGLPVTHIQESLWPEYLRENWEDKYAEGTIWFHPEYSAFYRHCVSLCGDVCYLTKKEIAQSDMYEYWNFGGDMSTQTDDQTAYAAGYFFPVSDDVGTGQNPTDYTIDHQSYMYVSGMTGSPEMLTDLAIVNATCSLSYCSSPNQEFEDIIQSYMTHFVEASTNEYYSIWYVMDDPAGIGQMSQCPQDLDSPVYDFFVSLHNSSTGLLNSNNPNHISKIQFFSGVYQFYKEYVIYNNLDCDLNDTCWGTNTWPHIDSCLINPHEHYNADQNGLSTGDDVHVPAGFALHFPKNPLFEAMGCDCSGDPSSFNLTAFAANTEEETCESNCLNHVDIWASKLENCSTKPGYSFNVHVRPALLYICEKSCSDDNAYFGGDEVPTGVDGYFDGATELRSFQEVVTHFYSDPCTAPQHPVYDCKWRCSCDMLSALIDGLTTELNHTPSNTEIAAQVTDLTGGTITYTASDITSWLSSCNTLIYNQDDCDQLEDSLLTPSGLHGIPELLICDDGSDMTWGEYLQQCIDDNAEAAESLMVAQFAHNLADYQEYILNEYNTRILPSIEGRETFTMEYTQGEYAYTLYYYDQAGNLVQTVPPEGVDLLDATEREDVVAHREHPNDPTNIAEYPVHTLNTTYAYNSFQGVIQQETPDGMKVVSSEHVIARSETNFYYDDNGRLVASQNAKQFNQPTKQYSFTRYDKLGRIVQTGQVYGSSEPYDHAADEYMIYGNYGTWLNNNTTRDQIVFTQYDEPYSSIINDYFGVWVGQQNLRNRVASVFRDDNNDGDYENAIHYSYDAHGNAKTVIRDNKALADIGKNLNKMDYTYNLINGNVLSMTSMRGKNCELIHKYSYDADNRLHRVYTKTLKGVWETDAKYFYYATGALARTEIGDKCVQGFDYIYTVNGWIRSVNSGMLSPSYDPGKDAAISETNSNAAFAKDAAGFTLGYYTPGSGCKELVSGTVTFEPVLGNGFKTLRKDLYNGNIAWSVHAVPHITTNGGIMVNEAHLYRYDQLNRIKSDKIWQNSSTPPSNDWTATIYATERYFSDYTYDFNGNLLYLNRKDNSSTAMDVLAYHYLGNNLSTSSIMPQTNMLLSYNDNANNGNPTTVAGDIENTLLLDFSQTDDATWNYIYDEIGNLIEDKTEEIGEIKWNVMGKISSITRSPNNIQSDLEFLYDPMGNRIGKIEKPRPAGVPSTEDQWKYTWYTLDAQGKMLASHSMEYAQVSTGVWNVIYNTEEAYIYGSNRLGAINNRTSAVFAAESKKFYSTYFNLTNNRFVITGWDNSLNPLLPCFADCYTAGSRTLGNKQYEFADHLGNILAVVTDEKLYIDNSSPFEARVISAQDYYPFGMLMNDRYENTENYRFGFNGKENDNEVKGTGNQQDYGMRIYDPRLGRFLCADPLIVQGQQYPWYSPYQFAGNKPIQFIDLDGLEECEPYQRRINWLMVSTFQTAAKASGEFMYRNKYEKHKYDGFNQDYNYEGVENEDNIVRTDFSGIVKRDERPFFSSYGNDYEWNITIPIGKEFASGQVKFYVKKNEEDMIVRNVRVADGYESDGAMSGSGGYKVKFKNSKNDVVAVVFFESQKDLDLAKKEYKRLQNSEYLKYVEQNQNSETYKEEKQKTESPNLN
ncbi:MAG: hypothetical protein A2W93_00675 [Bacteroidetes bacterium GWF2_43_63]|nr:MAG: hypothetical protein A2W94_10975 [Bacteroidetes bacterium GWE2_42_42]OFY54974.1 MAG: hypothetical protein A2W93_00675 [Bacteroidetes bacterium GWF2_43_63]HBG69518.1 hypothetical protein [Bacteroidales bacterium]HCB61315.1 hypothetical protein [Bacteroidales bacterium]